MKVYYNKKHNINIVFSKKPTPSTSLLKATSSLKVTPNEQHKLVSLFRLFHEFLFPFQLCNLTPDNFISAEVKPMF